MVLVLTTTLSLLDSYEACSPVWFGQCLHPSFISGPSLCYYLGSSSSDLLCPMLVHVPCRVCFFRVELIEFLQKIVFLSAVAHSFRVLSPFS